MSEPVCTILLTWRPHSGQLHIHLESYADEGERWWLDKETYEACHEPLDLLWMLRQLLDDRRGSPDHA